MNSVEVHGISKNPGWVFENAGRKSLCGFLLEG
jgi:hypothetical protein